MLEGYNEDSVGLGLTPDNQVALDAEFAKACDAYSAYISDWAIRKGFWETDYGEQTTTVKLALVVTEISEAIEAVRTGNGPDDHLEELSGLEAECADAMIRIMDLAHRRNLRLGEAIVSKMAYNEDRPYRHGKNF